MDTKGIDQLLSQLSATSALAAGKSAPAAEGGAADFAGMLKDAVEGVNAVQQDADKLAQENHIDIGYNAKADKKSWKKMQQFLHRIFSPRERRMSGY